MLYETVKIPDNYFDIVYKKENKLINEIKKIINLKNIKLCLIK